MLNAIRKFLMKIKVSKAIKKCDIITIEKAIASNNLDELKEFSEKVADCLLEKQRYKSLIEFCKKVRKGICSILSDERKIIMIGDRSYVIARNGSLRVPLELASLLDGVVIDVEELKKVASVVSIRERIESDDPLEMIEKTIAYIKSKGLVNEVKEVLPQIAMAIDIVKTNGIRLNVEYDEPRADLSVYVELKNTCVSWTPFLPIGEDPLAKLLVKSAEKEGVCDCETLTKIAEEVGARVRCVSRKPEGKVVTSYKYLDSLEGKFESVFLDRPFAAYLKGVDLGKVKDKLRNFGAKEIKVRSISKEAVEIFDANEYERLNAGEVKFVLHEPAGYRDVRIIFGYSTAIEGEYFATANKKYVRMLGLKEAREGSRRVIVPSTYDLMKFGNVKYALNGIREAFPDAEIYLVHKKPSDLSYNAKTVVLEKRRVELFATLFDEVEKGVKEVEERVKERWGFELRDYQRLALYYLIQPYANVRRPPLTFVILPTGSGKSLIFQSLALTMHKLFGGVTLVISPLLALIEDQVESLRRRGIKVCRIDGNVSPRQKERCIMSLREGKVPLVYLTPEQLEKEEVKEAIRWADINYVIIDEAHSASRWGRTFRPSYLSALRFLRKEMDRGKNLPLAFFSATMPEKEIKFILNLFGYGDYVKVEGKNIEDKVVVIKGPIIRENIEISGEKVKTAEERLDVLVERVKELSEWAESFGKPWIGLIFTSFVRSSREYENAEEIAKYIKEKLGIDVLVYHGQMSKREKKRVLKVIYEVSEGVRKSPRIVVATKAFGMGIDIPNIRWIIHFMISDSIEDYYQEVGRGGRDGLPVKAHLLYVPGYDDKRKFNLVKRQLLSPRFVYEIYKKIGEGGFFNIQYFSSPLRKVSDEFESAVERALYVLAKVGAIDYHVTRSKECKKCYIIKKLKEVGYGEIESFVRNFNLMELLKVRAALNLAKLIADGKVSSAIEVIERYLELGEEYGEREIRELMKLIVKIAESEGIVISDNGEFLVAKTFPKKAKVAKAIAYGVSYLALKDKMTGARVAVPWGLGEATKRAIKVVEETLNIDLDLEVVVYKDKPKADVIVVKKRKGEYITLEIKRP